MHLVCTATPYEAERIYYLCALGGEGEVPGGGTGIPSNRIS